MCSLENPNVLLLLNVGEEEEEKAYFEWNLLEELQRFLSLEKRRNPHSPVIGTPDSGQQGLRGRAAPTPGAAASNAGIWELEDPTL